MVISIYRIDSIAYLQSFPACRTVRTISSWCTSRIVWTRLARIAQSFGLLSFRAPRCRTTGAPKRYVHSSSRGKALVAEGLGTIVAFPATCVVIAWPATLLGRLPPTPLCNSSKNRCNSLACPLGQASIMPIMEGGLPAHGDLGKGRGAEMSEATLPEGTPLPMTSQTRRKASPGPASNVW